MKKLKRVVIKEELVALTGKVEYAIVLNQFIYWSERVRDVDNYIKEEMERVRKFSDGSTENQEDMKENLTKGWIYKTAVEMKEECMFEKSATTMERIMVSLVEKGWLDRRRNPKYKWDKTYQYRVNMLNIQQDLIKLGYALEGYSLGIETEESNLQNEASKVQNEESTLQNEGAIPKITSKSTLEKEEEEEPITLGAILAFINDQITKRQITNQKTLDAIFEVAAKCKAIGTTNRESMENFCIKIVEDKMSTFGQKQKAAKQTKKDSVPTVKEDQPATKEEWLEKAVGVRETKGDVDKMSAEEQEEYFKQAEELRKKLENLDK